MRHRSPPGTRIAIEAATDAGSSRSRRSNRATIGNVTTSNNDDVGDIVTLGFQAKNVRIVPAKRRVMS